MSVILGGGNTGNLRLQDPRLNILLGAALSAALKYLNPDLEGCITILGHRKKYRNV